MQQLDGKLRIPSAQDEIANHAKEKWSVNIEEGYLSREYDEGSWMKYKGLRT